ncbi:fumarylacetoacetate hydrolase family protein [candidate division KSB1 bacterium]
MKFVSYLNPQQRETLGLFSGGHIYPLKENAERIGLTLPAKMNTFLSDFARNLRKADTVERDIESSSAGIREDRKTVTLLPPVPHPPSFRNANAFRQHAEAARKSKGLDVPPEYDLFPTFCFGNHNALVGDGAEIQVEHDHLEKLDFGLAVAVIIGKKGRNIPAKEADSYIAGFTLVNDFSARALQAREMKLNFGPVKGKDFATAIGPTLVTPDELKPYRIDADHGGAYDLPLRAWHNGRQVSDGSLKGMSWTFAQLIERCSYGVYLYPGDIIGSGSAGTGCFLELNLTWAKTAAEKGDAFAPVWLKPGDTIELDAGPLGRLKNSIGTITSQYSISTKYSE